MDNELLEIDRIEIIKIADQKYNLQENAYLSFSGGKDSTILHYLLDIALPNNTIPRVYIDTGIEYNDIRKYVYYLAKQDRRIIIIQPKIAIKQMLEKYGYPFKSKEHSVHVSIYQKSGYTKSVNVYLGNIKSKKMLLCPNKLKYQFTPEFNIKISENCCRKLKKEPIKKWEKLSNRPIAITGMRTSEGGERASITNCILLDKEGKLKHFHPLLKVNDEWENYFIKKYNIQLCKLYNEPYNFKRSGCKGCPYALDLQQKLDTMAILLPNERKQCEIIWKPIYDEYRRIGYRLRKEKTIFDYL